MEPTVNNEWATLDLVRARHMSIARYGDGEFKLCNGHRQKSQEPGKEIQRRLREILNSQDQNLIVGIPNIYKDYYFKQMTEQKQGFWSAYRKKTQSLLCSGKTYGSSFISRSDSALWINTGEYWDAWLSIWEDKRVLLVEGERSRFNKAEPLKGASCVGILKGPDRNAFTKYVSILQRIKSTFHDGAFDLVILSLGPTATVLAAALSACGIWALDLGHFGMLYSQWKFARVREGEVAVKNKKSIYGNDKGIKAPGESRTTANLLLRLANYINGLVVKPEIRQELLGYIQELHGRIE